MLLAQAGDENHLYVVPATNLSLLRQLGEPSILNKTLTRGKRADNRRPPKGEIFHLATTTTNGLRGA
jgi:hypothetical protein